jgi:hypothetical protein
MNNINRTIVSFTYEEKKLFHQIGELADYIDNNFYHVPVPLEYEENEENSEYEFNEFKLKVERFFKLFEDFYELGTYKYKDRRTIEMDKLYTKLINNKKLLEGTVKNYHDNIENWSYIRGNNIEIDYIIDEYKKNI